MFITVFLIPEDRTHPGLNSLSSSLLYTPILLERHSPTSPHLNTDSTTINHPSPKPALLCNRKTGKGLCVCVCVLLEERMSAGWNGAATVDAECEISRQHLTGILLSRG